jgi:hypothetical protein
MWNYTDSSIVLSGSVSVSVISAHYLQEYLTIRDDGHATARISMMAGISVSQNAGIFYII